MDFLKDKYDESRFNKKVVQDIYLQILKKLKQADEKLEKNNSDEPLYALFDGIFTILCPFLKDAGKTNEILQKCMPLQLNVIGPDSVSRSFSTINID